jgi:hypothetical protein
MNRECQKCKWCREHPDISGWFYCHAPKALRSNKMCPKLCIRQREENLLISILEGTCGKWGLFFTSKKESK